MLTFNRNKYCSFKIGTNHEQKRVGPRDFEKKKSSAQFQGWNKFWQDARWVYA